MRLLSLLALMTSLATARPAPIPQVQQGLPGAVQPFAPGYRPATPLPTLALSPPLPGVRVVYAGNGSIEVASALALTPQAGSTADLLSSAQTVVARSFAARPALAEVDVSSYLARTYAGFGGPSPLLTVAVPRARLAAFLALTPADLATYDHLWQNPSMTPHPPGRAPSGETAPEAPEPPPTFEGSARQSLLQRLDQALSAVRGSRQGSGVLFHGPPTRRVIGLTFDDAVHPLYAPLLLDALRRGGAHATFFVVGRNVRAYPYFARDLVLAGHELANHTYHHVRLSGLGRAAITEELQRTDALILRVTGQDVRYFRPPGGRYSPLVLSVARDLGLTTAFWTDDPADFNNPGPQAIETALRQHLRPGGIILLHDNAPQTAGLLVDLINDARAQGYTLTTLSALTGQR